MDHCGFRSLTFLLRYAGFGMLPSREVSPMSFLPCLSCGRPTQFGGYCPECLRYRHQERIEQLLRVSDRYKRMLRRARAIANSKSSAQ